MAGIPTAYDMFWSEKLGGRGNIGTHRSDLGHGCVGEGEIGSILGRVSPVLFTPRGNIVKHRITGVVYADTCEQFMMLQSPYNVNVM